MSVCANDGCDSTAVSKGLCRRCYGRQWRQAHKDDPGRRERKNEVQMEYQRRRAALARREPRESLPEPEKPPQPQKPPQQPRSPAPSRPQWQIR